MALKSSNAMTLKIGLILDDIKASKYVYDLVQWSEKIENIEITHFIIQNSLEKNRNYYLSVIDKFKNKSLLDILSKINWKLINYFEYLLLKKTNFKNHLDQYDLSIFQKKVIAVKPLKSISGIYYEYSSGDIEQLQNKNLDLLIRCGSGILRGEILNLNKYGILSFHHGDNRYYRGGPAGFWEVYEQNNSSGFIIQQLTEKLDGGNIITRGNFTTKKYYLHNQAHLYSKSNYYMKNVLKQIANNNKLPNFEKNYFELGKIYKIPKLKVQLKYLIKLISQKLREKFEKKSKWRVHFSHDKWDNFNFKNSIELPSPPNTFLADPFIYEKDGKHYCFVEEFKFKNSKGIISLFEINNDKIKYYGKVIEEKFHLSFPYIFKYNNKYYMVPESSENKDIRLYESVNFPFQWKLKKIIFENIKAVDTMIIRKEDSWWLLTNIDPSNNGDNCSELFIYSSDDPIDGKWVAHEKNPVLIDSSQARNAGILYDENKILRVSQKQGFSKYGVGYNVSEIVVLNNNDYIEKRIYEYEANHLSNIKGAHHLHSSGKLTVFDFLI